MRLGVVEPITAHVVHVHGVREDVHAPVQRQLAVAVQDERGALRVVRPGTWVTASTAVLRPVARPGGAGAGLGT
eukprot:4307063-Alexandrium_andersonii.AAC.1